MRRDIPRRITPERMAFYRHRAKQLRDEAWRDMWRALWALLMKMLMKLSFRDGPKDQTRNLEIPGSRLRRAPE